MSTRVLITCPPMLKTLDSCQERFEQEEIEVVSTEIIQQLTEDELCDLIADVDGVIAGDDPYSERVLKAGRNGRLRALAKWGIGVDAIDLEAAKRLGIKTSNTPDVFGEEVADIAIGYTVMLSRQLHRIDAAVRQGDWLKIRGTSLQGKTAGIIGIGSIGRAVAIRYQAMGLNLTGYDIEPIADQFLEQTGLAQVGLQELFETSDIIVVACVLTKDNHYLLGNEAFEAMKDGVLIINVARGMLIEQDALIAALDSRKVSGAALDVFESEPVAANNPLCSYPQVILGSHNGSNTQEAVLRVNQLAIDNLVRDLSG